MMEEVQRRGGRERDMRDPRTSMLGWAMDRVTSAMPDMDHDVAVTLLKSENRTVSTLMNCKSNASEGGSTSCHKEVRIQALLRNGSYWIITDRPEGCGSPAIPSPGDDEPVSNPGQQPRADIHGPTHTQPVCGDPHRHPAAQPHACPVCPGNRCQH